MNYITEIHDSLGEFFAAVDSRPAKYDHDGDAEWHGTANYGEAMRIAKEGWREMRPKVDEYQSAIMDKVRQTVDLTHVPTLDLMGAAVDVGEFLTGVPECMIAFPTEPNPTIDRTLRVVMDPGASGSHSAYGMARRGAAVACLLEVLQILGYSLEIWIASPVRGVRDDGIYTPLVKANPAGQTVDIDGLMFACGHPSMLRRLFFSERYQHNGHSIWSMGSTVKMQADKLGLPDIDLLIQRAEWRDMAAGEPNSEDNPADWVLWALKHLGVDC